jgi:hypothetical protein
VRNRVLPARARSEIIGSPWVASTKIYSRSMSWTHIERRSLTQQIYSNNQITALCYTLRSLRPETNLGEYSGQWYLLYGVTRRNKTPWYNISTSNTDLER